MFWKVTLLVLVSGVYAYIVITSKSKQLKEQYDKEKR
tara:strand:- start:326 stop:436 length:111 start_codon:yes stop_codon:yes gene_type:complete